MKQLEHTCDNYKVGIVGCGRVGTTAAYAMLLDGFLNELVLLSRCVDKPKGEQLDFEHGMTFMSHTNIIASENYADLQDCDVVVITAGDAQKVGETRLDLANRNRAIISDMIPKIIKAAPNTVILMVSNPVDLLTYHAYKIAGLPKGRIFGTGTTLDSARFRFHLSEFLQINPHSIHAYVLGEHGDSSFSVLSSAMVGGQLLSRLPRYSEEKALAAYAQAKNAAYKIIEYKGSTYYAIGTVISHLVKSILKDSRSIYPVSVPLHNYLGHSGIAVSVPCIIGRNGVEEILEVKMSWEERQQFDRSVRTLKELL